MGACGDAVLYFLKFRKLQKCSDPILHAQNHANAVKSIFNWLNLSIDNPQLLAQDHPAFPPDTHQFSQEGSVSHEDGTQVHTNSGEVEESGLVSDAKSTICNRSRIALVFFAAYQLVWQTAQNFFPAEFPGLNDPSTSTIIKILELGEVCKSGFSNSLRTVRALKLIREILQIKSHRFLNAKQARLLSDEINEIHCSLIIDCNTAYSSASPLHRIALSCGKRMSADASAPTTVAAAVTDGAAKDIEMENGTTKPVLREPEEEDAHMGGKDGEALEEKTDGFATAVAVPKEFTPMERSIDDMQRRARSTEEKIDRVTRILGSATFELVVRGGNSHQGGTNRVRKEILEPVRNLLNRAKTYGMEKAAECDGALAIYTLTNPSTRTREGICARANKLLDELGIQSLHPKFPISFRARLILTQNRLNATTLAGKVGTILKEKLEIEKLRTG